MFKLLRGTTLTLGLFCNYSSAQINLGNLTQVLSGSKTQSPMSDLGPTSNLVTSLIQPPGSGVIESSTSKLTKKGAWYLFQNGDWRAVSQNDNFSNMDVALLIHDLMGDKTSLNALGLWLSTIPPDLKSYNISSSVVNPNSTGFFQAILAFEYPSMKSLQNRKGQQEVISSISEEFADQLIAGAKNTKSLTILAHGLGGLISRYALQQEFPTLIKNNEKDYKDIFKKIRLITLGTSHTGIPKQVFDIAYKKFMPTDVIGSMSSNIGQQVQNSLGQQNSLLGPQGNAVLGIFAPNLSVSNLGAGMMPQSMGESIPIEKEVETNSSLLASLNSSSFIYADQTDCITIAGNKSAGFQLGVEVGTAIQAIYTGLDATIKSDGLVSQYSANAKELEKFCINWAKNPNDRAYNINANHTELIGGQTNQSFIEQVAPILVKIFNMPLSSVGLTSSSAPVPSSVATSSQESVSSPASVPSSVATTSQESVSSPASVPSSVATSSQESVSSPASVPSSAPASSQESVSSPASVPSSAPASSQEPVSSPESAPSAEAKEEN